MEVEKISYGLMETNINPRLQEDDQPQEELTEIQVDPNKLSRVVKIDKRLKKKLSQQFTEFISINQDVIVLTYADMVGVHLEVMCHRLNINPQVKLVR